MNAVEGPLNDYAAAHTREVEDIIKAVEADTEAKSKQAQMMVGRIEGTFLHLLVEIAGAKRVLEIGTFTGYSALMMASALPQDGVLFTLERSEKHAMVARHYFDRSGFGHKIASVVGDARETLDDIEGPFDLIFIDADKSSYDFYYEKCLSLLSPGGVMVLDNMLWDGKVLDPHDEESVTIDRLNAKIAQDKRVENVLLTVRDGVMLVRKKTGRPSSDWRKDLEINTRNMIRREHRKESKMDSSRTEGERTSRPRQKPKAEISKSEVRGRRLSARALR